MQVEFTLVPAGWKAVVTSGNATPLVRYAIGKTFEDCAKRVGEIVAALQVLGLDR